MLHGLCLRFLSDEVVWLQGYDAASRIIAADHPPTAVAYRRQAFVVLPSFCSPALRLQGTGLLTLNLVVNNCLFQQNRFAGTSLLTIGVAIGISLPSDKCSLNVRDSKFIANAAVRGATVFSTCSQVRNRANDTAQPLMHVRSKATMQCCLRATRSTWRHFFPPARSRLHWTLPRAAR